MPRRDIFQEDTVGLMKHADVTPRAALPLELDFEARFLSDLT